MKIIRNVFYVFMISIVTGLSLWLFTYLKLQTEIFWPIVILTIGIIGLGIYLLKKKTLIGAGLLAGSILNIIFRIVFISNADLTGL
jgi:hypothetical protein